VRPPGSPGGPPPPLSRPPPSRPLPRPPAAASALFASLLTTSSSSTIRCCATGPSRAPTPRGSQPPRGDARREALYRCRRLSFARRVRLHLC
jgi:hypothetical protein